MKKNLIIYIVALGVLGLFSCKKDEDKLTINKASYVKPVLSSPSNGSSWVLTKNKADSTITFTWTEARYGVPTATTYSLQVDKKDNDFTDPAEIVSSSDLSAKVTFATVNTALTALELAVNEAAEIEFRVIAYVSGSTVDTLYSDVVSATATPYLAKDPYYLVGQHNNWDNTTAPEFNKYLSGLKYEIYVYLATANQGLKILPTLGAWDGDMGDDPDNPGKLIATGEQNMSVSTTGMHLIETDMSKMTWTATPVEWAIIGDFNSWSADLPLTYDSGANTLKVTTDLTAGGIKFRANASWDINYGDTGADGALDAGGDNISITSTGNYTITLDLHAYPYTYTVTKN